MLNDLIPLLLFYLIYSFAVTIVKSRDRKTTLRMLIDNNLINNGENNISFKYLSSEDSSSRKNYVLIVGLGMMGFGLGLICSAFLFVAFNDRATQSASWCSIHDAIEIGLPLFFASIGVVVAYFIEKQEDKK